MRRIALRFLRLAGACAKPSVADFAGPGTDAFVANRLAECEAWCGADGTRAARELLPLAKDHAGRACQREYVSSIAKLSVTVRRTASG